VKVYGTPAEEGGSGKVYLVRAGLFEGVDAVLHWHPNNQNSAMMSSYIANTSAKFRFRGIASHAAASPQRGRSALDGVEAMNNMVNMMREHVPQETRIHYIITNGGKAPNVVPEFAEVYYYVRHPNRDEVKDAFARVVKAAEGAALGTGTTMDYEIIGGTHELLLNETLSRALQVNLEQVGGVTYTAQEATIGKQLQASFGFPAPPLEEAAKVQPFAPGDGGGSSDVGDVSYVVPTVGLTAATWVPGTPAHSWQAVSCSGQEIGAKGMLVAAKTMTLTAIDMFTDPVLLQKATAEFKQDVGSYVYKPLLGDRKPALNYRD
jgi:aminobenzoyl-glutamate utilization protein B